MAEVCLCDKDGANLGLPNCDDPLRVPKGLYFVQTYDSTGVKNSIPSGTTLDDDYVSAKINHVDKSQRWFPLQEIKGIESARAEDVVDEDGAYVKDGERPFSFYIKKGSATMVKKLKTFRCAYWSIFLIDDEGKVIGMDLTGLSALYPIRIDRDTLSINYGMATDTQAERITVSFKWDPREKDENLSYITPEADADMLSYNGLLDIKSTYSNITTTGFIAALRTDYGGLNEKGKLTGLVSADFVLYNITDSATVTITSVNEATDGSYTFVIPAQTSGDKLRLTPTKASYDFTSVVSNVITIP